MLKRVNRIASGAVVAESISDNRFPGTIGIWGPLASSHSSPPCGGIFYKLFHPGLGL